MASMQPRNPKGLATRQVILRKACDLASVAGLAGLTIGSLAEVLEMSKSGLFAHFGSKEELQLAVLEAAAALFHDRVVEAAAGKPPGLERLQALAEAWTRYLESGAFRGGCLFAAVSSEFDDRPGKVRNRIAQLTDGWLGLLEQQAAEALSHSQIDGRIDPAQVAFELHAFFHEANRTFQLHGRADAFERCRIATRRLFERIVN